MPIGRSWFEYWRNPREFFCAAWEQIKLVTESPPPDYIRDAYVAGLFARIWNYHSTCEVRLIAEREQFPDAQLREDENTINLEIAIADKQDRRIWKEQKEWAEMYKRGEFLAADSPDKRRDDAREAISRIVKQKVEHYLGKRIDGMVPDNANLLVYLMTSQAITTTDRLITVEEMALLTEPYKNNFQSIWLLCGKEDVRVWPTGKVLGVPPDQDPFDCRADAT